MNLILKFIFLSFLAEDLIVLFMKSISLKNMSSNTFFKIFNFQRIPVNILLKFHKMSKNKNVRYKCFVQCMRM